MQQCFISHTQLYFIWPAPQLHLLAIYCCWTWILSSRSEIPRTVPCHGQGNSCSRNKSHMVRCFSLWRQGSHKLQMAIQGQIQGKWKHRPLQSKTGSPWFYSTSWCGLSRHLFTCCKTHYSLCLTHRGSSTTIVYVRTWYQQCVLKWWTWWGHIHEGSPWLSNKRPQFSVQTPQIVVWSSTSFETVVCQVLIHYTPRWLFSKSIWHVPVYQRLMASIGGSHCVCGWHHCSKSWAKSGHFHQKHSRGPLQAQSFGQCQLLLGFGNCFLTSWYLSQWILESYYLTLWRWHSLMLRSIDDSLEDWSIWPFPNQTLLIVWANFVSSWASQVLHTFRPFIISFDTSKEHQVKVCSSLLNLVLDCLLMLMMIGELSCYPEIHHWVLCIFGPHFHSMEIQKASHCG